MGWTTKAAVLLCVMSGPAIASEGERIFCERVFKEVQPVLEGIGRSADADEAQLRSWTASKANLDFALEHPERLLDANEEADRRSAALPAQGDARAKALVDAYEQCGVNDGYAEQDRVPQLFAYQQFCRPLLKSFVGKVEQKPEAATPDWQARLAEMRAIVQALEDPAIKDRSLDRRADARAAGLMLQHGARLEAGPSQVQAVEAEVGACHRAGMAGELGIKVQRVAVRAVAPAFDLGAVFLMREVAPGGNYDGTWTRRGNSNVYDARWVFGPTGQVIVDVLEVQGVQNGELVIHRRGIKPLYGYEGYYRAPVKADGTLGPGSANWVTIAGYHWERTGSAASATGSIPSGDAGALFCLDVYREAHALLVAGGAKAEADYVLERSLALGVFESNLQRSNAAGHAAARQQADARRATLPAGRERTAALRAAHEACLGREGALDPPSARARQAAEQRFCASLLQDITAPLRENPASLEEKTRSMMVELAAAATALNAPEVQFRTDMTAKDDRDAEKLFKQKDAELQARLGKADHDDVLGEAAIGCYDGFVAGRLGAVRR